jgi:hypothetical protein
MAESARSNWKQIGGSLLAVAVILAMFAAFLWFLIRQIGRLDSDVAAATIGATATIVVSAFAIFVGRYFENRRELEAAAREKRIPLYEDFIEFWFRQLYADRLGEEPATKEEITKVMVDFYSRRNRLGLG